MRYSSTGQGYDMPASSQIYGRTVWLAAIMAGLLAVTAQAQVPSTISYQGRVVVQGMNYDGAGQFKFSLIDPAGTMTFWSNDGTGLGAAEPANAATIAVSKGLFAVRLGDTNVANMTPIPANVFTNADVRLRVWFSRGTGFEQLSPDTIVAAVGYAMISASVANRSITPQNLDTNVMAMFVNSSGGAMTGALTNHAGFYGNGGGLTNLAPGAYVEVDPFFAASVAAVITGTDTGRWTAAYTWGNHVAAGYLSATNNLSDLGAVSVARVNLGLGSIATQNMSAVAITGGSLSNVTLHATQDGMKVGDNQMVVESGNVGIGTPNPTARLEVVGGETTGDFVFRFYSGSNLLAWGKKK